jgi:hypothetical protein
LYGNEAAEETKRLQGLRADTLMENCQSTESRDGMIRCPIPCKSSRYSPTLWSGPSGSCYRRISKYLFNVRANDIFLCDSGGIGNVNWELHKIFLISFWARFISLQFFHHTTKWCFFECPSTYPFISYYITFWRISLPFSYPLLGIKPCFYSKLEGFTFCRLHLHTLLGHHQFVQLIHLFMMHNSVRGRCKVLISH